MEELTLTKRKKKQYHIPYNIKAIKWEEGKRKEILWTEKKEKMGVGKIIKLLETLYTPEKLPGL